MAIARYKALSARRRRIDIDERLEHLTGRHERGRVGVPGIERSDLGRESDAKRAALLRPGRRGCSTRGRCLATDADQNRERKGRDATHEA